MADDKTYTQEQLDAAVAKAVGDVDGLKAKVEELIGDKKKLTADLRKVSEIKPEDLTAAEERAEKAEAALAAAQKAAKEATTAAEKAAKALETEQGFTQKLLIQDGLKSALIANGVKDEDYIDTLAARFARDAKVLVEGEERKALIGDKPMPDYIKEWAGTDAGKKFVAAPANSGGGAPGGKGGGDGAKTIPRAQFDAMSQAERMAFSKEGGKAADPIA